MCKILWQFELQSRAHIKPFSLHWNLYFSKFKCSQKLLLLSFFTDKPDEQAYLFALLDLEQLVLHATLIPNCLGDMPNILYLSLTSNPSAYSVQTVLSFGVLQSQPYSSILSYHLCITAESTEDAVPLALCLSSEGWPKDVFSDFLCNKHCPGTVTCVLILPNIES